MIYYTCNKDLTGNDKERENMSKRRLQEELNNVLGMIFTFTFLVALFLDLKLLGAICFFGAVWCVAIEDRRAKK